MTIRVACVGGGPGGLFFAALLKQYLPEAHVEVIERNQATDTFGFGVVFSDATLRRINDADPVLRDGLAAHGEHWNDIAVVLKGERLTFAGNGMAAIHRKTLLQLLQERAREVGVVMTFGRAIRSLDELDDFDIVVGADGTNSFVREAIGVDLGSNVDVASAKFIWFGTTYPFTGLTFVHRRSEFGNFAVHAYPISDSLSTFIVETDEKTWRAAGLDEFDVTAPPGPSDEKSQLFLTELFADDIDGHPLVTNNSRWGNFRTRRTALWHHGNVALLGDAVHTAHFSVGSGTKMAMEDAVVLARSIAAHPTDAAIAFSDYETERMPQVAKIQNSARPSLSWWEHFGDYYEAFDPLGFAFHFFSRSIDVDKIRQRDPALASSIEAKWSAEHDGAAPLDTPLRLGDGRQFANRRLWLEAADDQLWLSDSAGLRVPLVTDPALVRPGVGYLVEAPAGDDSDDEREVSALPAEAAVIVVRGGSTFRRLLLAEQARLRRGVLTVIVNDDDDVSAAATILLSQRADAVATTATDREAIDVPA